MAPPAWERTLSWVGWPQGEGVHRMASALRTTLVGAVMLRFDAAHLVGPAPVAGRVVERVGSRGTHLKIEWDDGLILHTHLRVSGSWHLYRSGDPWRRPYHRMRVAIEVADWIAVCFDAPIVETYRGPDRRRHPGRGRLGPDLAAPDTDLDAVVNLLLTYPDGDACLADVLLDERVVRGVGNVDRCEVLWVDELSPFATVGSLSECDAVRVVRTAASIVRASRRGPGRHTPGASCDLAVYGRNGQPCDRCGTSVTTRRSGTHRRRLLYWCPGCQLHHRPPSTAAGRAVAVDGIDAHAPMDPHPAAARFLADLPWNRPA